MLLAWSTTFTFISLTGPHIITWLWLCVLTFLCGTPLMDLFRNTTCLKTRLLLLCKGNWTFRELQTARESDDDIICCVKWVNEGNILAVGGVDGGVELYNVSDSKLLRKMSGHQDRVAALSWNEFILASGCRDGSVHLHDVRIATHLTNELLSHTQASQILCEKGHN